MRRARLIRQDKNLSLFDVARATDILPQTLSRFEQNQRLLRYPSLKKLATFFGVTIDDLLIEVPENGSKEQR